MISIYVIRIKYYYFDLVDKQSLFSYLKTKLSMRTNIKSYRRTIIFKILMKNCFSLTFFIDFNLRTQ